MDRTNEQLLPWNFEQLREYLDYDTLLNAAAVLYQYEGEIIDTKNPRIQKMQHHLELRTNKETWIPKRTDTEGVNWSTEGNVFRNKRRVFTSLFILALSEEEDKICLLPFGRALAVGKISENEFYDFIIRRYKYPHPAYEDNFRLWTNAQRELYPFQFILQILIELFSINPHHSFLTTEETLRILYPVSDHEKVNEVVTKIISNRDRGELPDLSVSPVEAKSRRRNITDIFGFLCKSGYVFYRNASTIELNLLGKHSKEKTYYWKSRTVQQMSEDRLYDITNLIVVRRV